MSSTKRQRVSLGVFEAVRSDAPLTGTSEIPVAPRPEWIWTAQILARLSRENAKPGSRLCKVYARAIAGMQSSAVVTVSDRASAFTGLLIALTSRESRKTATTIAECAAILTDDAEAGGFVKLASAIAASALRVCNAASTTAQAKLLTRVARGYRASGNLTKAEELYRRVRSLGRRARNHDALTRGTLGLAVVARERGNYHEAARRFRAALRLAERSRSRELQIFAHQGMHVVGEITGDLATLVRHAWLAYTLSIGDAEREVETLHNIAMAGCVAGLVDEAIAVFRAVLDHRVVSPRMRFHYLRSLAKAAALSGRRDVLDGVRARLTELGTETPYAYEYSMALVNLAGAYSMFGESQVARKLRNEGLALARRFGLTEVVHTATHTSPAAERTYQADQIPVADLEELRRTFRTIAAGVLDSRAMAGERAEGTPRGERA